MHLLIAILDLTVCTPNRNLLISVRVLKMNILFMVVLLSKQIRCAQPGNTSWWRTWPTQDLEPFSGRAGKVAAVPLSLSLSLHLHVKSVCAFRDTCKHSLLWMLICGDLLPMWQYWEFYTRLSVFFVTNKCVTELKSTYIQKRIY